MVTNTDSPRHSSSNSSSSSSGNDDFAAALEIALDSNSDDLVPDEEATDTVLSDSSDSLVEETKEDCIIISNRVKRPRVERLESLEEIQSSSSDGPVEPHFETPLKKDNCSHPGWYGGMCYCCGQRMDKEESGVTFRYIHKELRLGNNEVTRLRTTDMKSLMRHKKLYLVLDLDHTLLNSTQFFNMTEKEQYLKEQQMGSSPNASKDNLFVVDSVHMITKLRPYVHTFLKEANKMFQMYIYTMGDRPYALEMAKLLDPRSEYFGDRVISRDDGTEKYQKGLDVVLGHESAVVILDDTENAWTKHKDNVVVMERYHYFASSHRQFRIEGESHSELKTDESDSDGALVPILKLLRQTHSLFFNELADNFNARDVRQVLKTERKRVLRNCSVVFSGVFRTELRVEEQPFWKMAEEMGARCFRKIDPSVTHVVSTSAGSKSSQWAVRENKLLVNQRWIETAYFRWQKQPEENFPVA